MFKNRSEIIVIQAEAKDPIPTKVVFWSHDKGTAKLIFELQKDRVGQPLAEGTIVPICLDFVGGRHIYHAVIEDALNGIVSIILEDNILGYQGKVDGSIYIELPDKRSLDTAGRFSFEIKRSPIDEEVPELEDYYWQGFNEIMESYHQTIAGIKSEAKELLDSLKQDVSSTQEKVSQLEQSISTANTNLNARIDEIRKKIDENDVFTKSESSANVIYQLIGKEKVRLTFILDAKNKIAGSDTENPNCITRAVRTAKPIPPAGAELTNGTGWDAYEKVSTLDGTVLELATGNDYPFMLFDYDVLEVVKRELGENFFTSQGATSQIEQVDILRRVTNTVTTNSTIWGHGSSVNGNRIYHQLFNRFNSQWQYSQSNTASGITPLNIPVPAGNMQAHIMDDGHVHGMTYTDEAADGTMAKIRIDYARLEFSIEISAYEYFTSVIAAYHRENLATQEEAESGESDEKSMTPLATKQSIEKRSVLLAGDQDLDGKKNFLVMPTVGGKEFLTTDDLPITAALWLGASFLSAAHTLSLSKNIADCASGIALKFNPYNTSSGSSYTSQTSWCIIPKHHVLGTASGQNTFCPIYKQDGTFVGAKVITVSPTKIVGADVNAVGVLYEYVLTGVYEV